MEGRQPRLLRFWWSVSALRVLTAVFATTAVAAIPFAFNRRAYADVVEQNDLLRRIAVRDAIIYDKLQASNNLCSDTLVDMLQRLGLDDELLPLVPTLYWRRLTDGARVSTAYRQLSAGRRSKGTSNRSTLAGVDTPAMGGPGK